MMLSEKIDVQYFLPHRAPFLFIDDAVVDGSLEQVTATHTFKLDEPYFSGHFPGNPIVPGVVLIECMAQACRLLLNVRMERVVPGYLVGVETAKFLSLVRPLQTVTFDCRLEPHFSSEESQSMQMYSFRCSAFVEKVRCARCSLQLYKSTTY